jgi:hypothetical protein
MAFDEYALEQMVGSRLAEARACPVREAIRRALDEAHAARPGRVPRLAALLFTPRRAPAARAAAR